MFKRLARTALDELASRIAARLPRPAHFLDVYDAKVSGGFPIPWCSYAAIEYLSHLDFYEAAVLEYGSGNSSLWWLLRCARITSVESNDDWYRKLQRQVGTNPRFNYIKASGAEYVRREEINSSDIVVIDGDHRRDCAEWFIAKIEKGTARTQLLIFDDAEWFPLSISRLRSLGWIEVDFHGFKPLVDYTTTTSVFIRPGTTFKYHGPLRSSSGLIQTGTTGKDDDIAFGQP
jgi:hypothetical protein